MTKKEGIYHQAVKTLRHDARNLQNAIEVIERHLAAVEDEKGHRYIGMVRERIASMVAIGERAEMLAEIGPANMVEADLADLVQELVESASAAPQELSVDVPPCTVELDPKLTQLALQEVLSNALSAGGPVSITFSDEQDRTILRVLDSGPGIPEPAQPNLLTPFKGARRPGGTSLGLPLADAAMKAQGGELVIEKSGEEGTSVCLTWPSPPSALNRSV
ncbi:MAG: HAMP domain-containing sensor histidine kinase [Parvularcula sp.]|jgi:signal transduction histidine kinase|nr:HAMP domain-containing sensor histidine kinase [Parvularcula sp.]